MIHRTIQSSMVNKTTSLETNYQRMRQALQTPSHLVTLKKYGKKNI